MSAEFRANDFVPAPAIPALASAFLIKSGPMKRPRAGDRSWRPAERLGARIYLLLRRSGVAPRWATAATLPVLLDGFMIEDEHMVMAEALFTFLVMLAMLLILWRTRSGGRSRC